MSQAAKARLVHTLAASAVVLAVGLAYAVFCRRMGFALPCVFHLVTGKLCPGCGISRMFLSLLDGDLRAAWHYNPALLCMLPLGAVLAGDIAVRYVREGTKRPHRWATVLAWCMTAGLLVFGVARNFFPAP